MLRSVFLGHGAARWLPVVLALSSLTASGSRACVDPTPIVAGLDSVVSTGAPGPLFWSDPEIVPIIAGDEDTPVPRTFAVARGYGTGRVVALGHDGLTHNADFGFLDNRRFVLQAFDWLDVRHARRLAITTGHGEGLGFVGDSLRAAAVAAGWAAEFLPGVLDEDRLAPYSVVIDCNGVGLPPTAAEREALRAWVEDGGGLFLQGCGWGFAAYHPDLTLDDYPMNQLAAPFGIRWIGGSIDDPTDRYAECTLFHRFHPDLVGPIGVPEALDALRTIGTAHAVDLPMALESDLPLRRLYVDSHLMIPVAERNRPAGSPEREALYQDYRQALDITAPWYRREAPYDIALWPTMTRLRERAAVTLADAAPLTPQRLQEVRETLALEGERAALWLGHGVLLLDDCRLDSAQVGFIHALMDSIPASVHNLRAISVEDFLPRTTPNIPLDGAGTGSVNIFAAPVGGSQENDFPDDSPPWFADLFGLVVAHEVSHAIDACLAAADPGYRAHRDSILSRAGADSMNYCRVGGSGGFQGGGAVEFFASHSQQWFSNSALMMDLGVARFAGGRPCPIEDPYLFAEVLSAGGSFTRFFTLNAEGVLTTARVPVGRDGAGRITDLWYAGKHLRLELGADGRITGVGLGPTGVPPSAAAATLRLEVWPNPSHGAVWVRASGVVPAGTRVALYDAAGRCVARGQASGDGLWRLDASGPGGARLRPGLYVVRLEGAARAVTRRLVLLE